MTFMLGYAWKRRNNAAKAGHQSPAPLAIQASGDTDENCSPPPTPEGLRPRKSLDTIREELELPAQILRHQGQTLPCLPPQASPLISNSSFYSRDSPSVMVAVSPDLGQARTAVGALVAMTQGVVSNKPARPNAPDGRLGVLPPRTWDQQVNEEEEDDVKDVSYQRLQDSMDVWTPGRRRNAPTQQQLMSPESTVNSSIHPSPSGSSWRGWQQHRDEQRDVSFSSQVALVTKRKESHAYDFDPIDTPGDEREGNHGGPDYVLATDSNMANVSLLSHSTAAHNDSIHSLDSVRYSYGSRSQYEQREEDAMEDALLQRKAKNQRRAKEQLLMGVVQRLQHNLDLVSSIDALHEEEDRWFVKTPMDKDGLLTGFGKGTRSKLLKYVRSVLREMEVARPEEFFLSPSQIEGMADTHDDLQDALVFLEGMLQIAIPLDDQITGQRWTCQPEIRSAMGITTIPESPETIRGGDTSLFSLPSESTTPHTSNVSMATTITSKPSPCRNNYRSTLSNDATQIRRTIEIVSTLLQKMTIACHKLTNRCSSEDSILATEEIKRNYLQLMELKHHDVRCVVDAFAVETVMEAPLARQVSAEEDAVQVIPESALPAEPMQYVAGGKATEGVALNDMFSPCTADMQSARIEPDDDEEEYEEDDLRRQVGSNDYEDEIEERDAPEDERMRDGVTPTGAMVMKYSWGASEFCTTPYQNPYQKYE